MSGIPVTLFHVYVIIRRMNDPGGNKIQTLSMNTTCQNGRSQLQILLLSDIAAVKGLQSEEYTFIRRLSN